jgi:hypothetical protein
MVRNGDGQPEPDPSLRLLLRRQGPKGHESARRMGIRDDAAEGKLSGLLEALLCCAVCTD